MEGHICTVKAKSQAGNTWVKGIMTTQTAKATIYSTRNLTNFHILHENLAVWPLKIAVTLLSGERMAQSEHIVT